MLDAAAVSIEPKISCSLLARATDLLPIAKPTHPDLALRRPDATAVDVTVRAA
jgi:hypothetical protein